MKKNKPITTEDILIKLCNSVKNVLSAAAQTPIDYSPMIQRITKTSLKPDIGCFVVFDGAFSGLVVINFSAAAALEVYQSSKIPSFFWSQIIPSVLVYKRCCFR